jgi:hypothetical protein
LDPKPALQGNSKEGSVHVSTVLGGVRGQPSPCAWQAASRHVSPEGKVVPLTLQQRIERRSIKQTGQFLLRQPVRSAEVHPRGVKNTLVKFMGRQEPGEPAISVERVKARVDQLTQWTGLDH